MNKEDKTYYLLKYGKPTFSPYYYLNLPDPLCKKILNEVFPDYHYVPYHKPPYLTVSMFLATTINNEIDSQAPPEYYKEKLAAIERVIENFVDE